MESKIILHVLKKMQLMSTQKKTKNQNEINYKVQHVSTALHTQIAFSFDIIE
jgi:hypothetical protein